MLGKKIAPTMPYALSSETYNNYHLCTIYDLYRLLPEHRSRILELQDSLQGQMEKRGGEQKPTQQRVYREYIHRLILIHPTSRHTSFLPLRHQASIFGSFTW
jgi:hypothetical protein